MWTDIKFSLASICKKPNPEPCVPILGRIPPMLLTAPAVMDHTLDSVANVDDLVTWSFTFDPVGVS